MIEKISELLASLPHELYVFIISILPIIELRGAIPVGTAFGLPFYLNYALAVLGNLLPIPFILAFVPKVLHFLAKFRIFRPIVDWIRNKADKYKDKIIKTPRDESVIDIKEQTADASSEEAVHRAVEKRKPDRRQLSAGVFTALMAFVAIPLPGTGAWTGALVASVFKLPKQSSFLAIALGVMISGVIMCLASYGVLGFLSFLL